MIIRSKCSRLSDDIRHQAAFDHLNLVAQPELPFFESHHHDLIACANVDERIDARVKITVFSAQSRQSQCIFALIEFIHDSHPNNQFVDSSCCLSHS